MDKLGLLQNISKFLDAHPDDNYNFVCSTFQGHTFSIDALEDKSEFRKAGEILDAARGLL